MISSMLAYVEDIPYAIMNYTILIRLSHKTEHVHNRV